MPDQRVLKIEQAIMGHARLARHQHDILGMIIAQHGDARQAVMLDRGQHRLPRAAKGVAVDVDAPASGNTSR